MQSDELPDWGLRCPLQQEFAEEEELQGIIAQEKLAKEVLVEDRQVMVRMRKSDS